MSTLDREELFISIYDFDFITSTNCFVVILKPIVHTEDINAIKVRKDLFQKAFMEIVKFDKLTGQILLLFNI